MQAIKRTLDPAIVRTIHERVVKAAVAELATELMSDAAIVALIERRLTAGDPPNVVERMTRIELDERLHPSARVLAYRGKS
jgi:hypothetical protein